MQSLPTTENTELATRSDLERLGLDLRREMDVMGREIRADLKTEIATVHTAVADITKQMALQFRLTLLLQIGVIVAVAGIVAALS